MKFINLFVAFLLMLGLPACSSFLKIPAIPQNKLSVSEELKYIYHTDQKDRRQNIFRFITVSDAKLEQNKKLMALSERDSIRLKRIIALNTAKLIEAPRDCFYAAIIYIHNGGMVMAANRPQYVKTAVQLLDRTIETTDNPKLKKRAIAIKQYELAEQEQEQKEKSK